MISFYKRITLHSFLQVTRSYCIPPAKEKLPYKITVEFVVDNLFQGEKLNQEYISKEIFRNLKPYSPAENPNSSPQTKVNQKPLEINVGDFGFAYWYWYFKQTPSAPNSSNPSAEKSHPSHTSQSPDRSTENFSSKIENEPSFFSSKPTKYSSWGSDDD